MDKNNDTIMADIGEAVAQSMSEEKKSTEPVSAEQKTEEIPTASEATAVTPTEGETPKSETHEAPAFTASDELIERAVKAGLSVADAKAFANAEQADRILSRLEGKTSKKPTGEGEVNGDGTPAEDELPDLPDDGEYDPQIVALFKGMKNMLKSQASEIATLKRSGESAAKQSFFDKQYGTLDEGVRSHVDAAKKSMLKSKFDILEAGYKAAKADISREEIFKEATQLALGDLVERAGAESKAAKLAQRRTLALARPGGETGSRKTGKPVTDEDIASAIWDNIK